MTIDEEEKTTHTISMNGNYTTQAWFLTEDGLYEVMTIHRHILQILLTL